MKKYSHKNLWTVVIPVTNDTDTIRRFKDPELAQRYADKHDGRVVPPNGIKISQSKREY